MRYILNCRKVGERQCRILKFKTEAELQQHVDATRLHYVWSKDKNGNPYIKRDDKGLPIVAKPAVYDWYTQSVSH